MPSLDLVTIGWALTVAGACESAMGMAVWTCEPVIGIGTGIGWGGEVDEIVTGLEWDWLGALGREDCDEEASIGVGIEWVGLGCDGVKTEVWGWMATGKMTGYCVEDWIEDVVGGPVVND